MFRYTWPGKVERWICFEHSGQVNAIAEAMGLPLQFIPLTVADILKGA